MPAGHWAADGERSVQTDRLCCQASQHLCGTSSKFVTSPSLFPATEMVFELLGRPRDQLSPSSSPYRLRLLYFCVRPHLKKAFLEKLGSKARGLWGLSEWRHRLRGRLIALLLGRPDRAENVWEVDAGTRYALPGEEDREGGPGTEPPAELPVQSLSQPTPSSPRGGSQRRDRGGERAPEPGSEAQRHCSLAV